ncbi:hypothetical protein [Clostridium tagluense]|uniref:Uncharacterized protein n=1 Tax=Clostridium tagluense TaxID=360422 RepID=A0A401UNL3_9CLOT|nr:hypothetical protein [Clostridium tagluense]GCD11091.1 hypothetical protein Ctaglu_27140 [Clostridium tagluense]
MDKEILEILKSMQTDIKSMQTDIKSMQTDMKLVKTDIKSMQTDIKSVQTDIKSVQTDVISIQQDVKSVKTTQEEHTQILRALEHKTDVISAEQENLKHEVAEIKGDVKGIRKDLSNVELITASNWSDIVKLKAVKEIY